MAVTINSGDLKHKVILKYSTSGKNTQGELTVLTWTVGIITFAKIEPVSNNRISEANASAMLNSKDFYIRWSEERAEVTKDWVLVYRGEDYVINSIDILQEREKFIRINAKNKHA